MEVTLKTNEKGGLDINASEGVTKLEVLGLLEAGKYLILNQKPTSEKVQPRLKEKE